MNRFCSVFVLFIFLFSACGGEGKNEQDQDIKKDTGKDLYETLKDSKDSQIELEISESVGEKVEPEATDDGIKPDDQTNEIQQDIESDILYKDGTETAESSEVQEDLPPQDLPEFCIKNEQCDDKDPCTIDECDVKTSKCINKTKICDPGISCFTGECTFDGTCLYKPVITTDCYMDVIPLKGDFDNQSLQGFVITDLASNTSDSENKIQWNLYKGKAHSGNYSLYFGDPEKHNYDNGKVVASSAESPGIKVPDDNDAVLVFWTYMDVEDGDYWDVLSIDIVVVDEQVKKKLPSWSKGYGFPMKQWVPVQLNLNGFAGKNIQVVVKFNSVDNTYNKTEGVYIDDIFVLSKQTAIFCSDDKECDDKINCTHDTCISHKCIYSYSESCCSLDIDCDDFDACTDDLCKDGGCIHIENTDPLCCNGDADCNDNNECTDDYCKKNKCQYFTSTKPGCCKLNTDCDDKEACTIDKCDASQCVHINTCCYSDQECDDNDDLCTTDKCVNKKCVFKPTGAPGCCSPEIFTETFDIGDIGTFTLSAPSGNDVGWHIVTTGKSTSPSGSLYYGNPAKKNFNSGAANSGTATSVPIDIPEGVEILFEFQLYQDTEQGGYYDVLTLKLTPNDEKAISLWTSAQMQYTDYKKFTKFSFNLTAFAGKTVKIQFFFDTKDSVANDTEGIYIDDFAVKTTCVQKSCTDSKECNDNIVVTEDICEQNVCIYTAKSVECVTDKDCDDGDWNTYDYCSNGVCYHEWWEYGYDY
jgi:hypothetical protein